VTRLLANETLEAPVNVIHDQGNLNTLAWMDAPLQQQPTGRLLGVRLAALAVIGALLAMLALVAISAATQV
jgi:hypothetical protein